MNKTLILALSVLLFAGGILMIVTAAAYHGRATQDGESGAAPPVYEHGDWKDIPILEQFTLTERSGELFHSKEMDGEVWVVSFFFSSCPSICRQQNTRVAELAREYGPKGVTFVNITVDPENDTPAVLRKYAHSFNADEEDWLFLTGDLLHIRRIGTEIFQLPTDQQAHSERLIVVDRWGKVRDNFHWREYEDFTAMKKALDELLAETEPPVEAETKVEPAGYFDEETGRYIRNESP
ncbi:MAG: SCO family protein [Pirellulaceae bacterium]